MLAKAETGHLKGRFILPPILEINYLLSPHLEVIYS